VPVRFGIIGTGGIAQVHADAIASCDGAELVACHSRSAARGRRFAASNHCDYAETLQALFLRSDCDAVAITSPSGTHAEIGILAARHGKHVLCEKPLDVSLERIDELIDSCRRHGVRLGAIFQSRFGPGVLALRDAIQQGRFGQLTQCSAHVLWWRDPQYYSGSDWRGTRQLDGGGALMNQGIHAVDQLLWLVGGVREVSARMQTRLHDIEVEDSVIAWLEYDNGALGTIQASTACYPGEGKRIEIRGERGSVILVDDVPALWAFDRSEPADAEIALLGTASAFGGGASVPLPASSEGHCAQYRDFVAAIRDDREPAIKASEGRAAVQLIQAIYESSRLERIIRLPR
jgi:UDP-N-acetyl-2-amino-2-deoxyglucuronate dehydrogenase